MATLKDVAEMAGVSVSTVSYVMNGKKTVRPDTLKRINDAIEQLDYYPNLQASGLKTNQSKVIGIVVSDMTSMFVVDVLCAIEKELAEREYCIIVCNSNDDPQQERRCVRRLLARSIDGMILIGTGINDFSDLEDMSMPLVCIDRNLGDQFYTVQSDNVYGGKIGTEYLISKGYRRILFLGNQMYRFSQERYQGYKTAMKEAGLESQMLYGDLKTLRAAESRQLVEKLLHDGAKFDAVYGCMDYYSIGAMNALVRSHIRIPEDVGVLGTDDIESAQFVVPSLSSVAQDKTELGTIAVHQLLKLLNHETPEKKQVLVLPRLVVRESC